GVARDVYLVQLDAVLHRESEGRTHRANGQGLWQRGTEALLEPRERAAPRQLRGDDGRMRILPSVVPETSQGADLRGIHWPAFRRRVGSGHWPSPTRGRAGFASTGRGLYGSGPRA